MSARERMRLDILSRVKRQELTVVEAAESMGVSLRQSRRLWKRFKSGGAAALVHGLRGRVSNRRLPEEFRDQIVRRHQARYCDFGPTLACEKLAEEGLKVSPDTLVAILQERHLWRRRCKAGRHRKRRERQAHFGQMVQMDGSHHDWFEGRGTAKTWCVLMVIVDDATGQTYARFYPAETTEAAFDVLGRWIGAHGVPRKVYVDRHGIYRSEEAFDGSYPPTQFGRAMHTLGTELILARSPQAKGRVERKHRVFQDRLVKELRLRSISDLEQANVLLEKVLLPELNRRYAIKPQRLADLHGPAPAGLQEILCVREDRVVGQDWCVRWKNRWLQIESSQGSRRLAGKKVVVKELGSGKLLVLREDKPLDFKELAGRPKAARIKLPVPQINNRRWKPGPDHPYNRQGRGAEKFFAAKERCGLPPPQRSLAAGEPLRR